jgi:NitT/TauT family transport system ATP-binding protein
VSHPIDLPDYRVMDPEVADRFVRLRQRPVVLQVASLGKQFRSPQGQLVTALHDINFSVHRREFMCIIGPSGCGKSTLNRIIAGLDHPTSGSVLLDGHPVAGPGPDRGMVFQNYTLFPWLTVKKNVMFGPTMRGVGPLKAQRDAMQWLDIVGLADFADHYPQQLSGGMKQRVAIARALANRPRILLMDEPFGALDAQTRANMQSYLLQIWQNVDITILFVTHDLDEAIYLADRILVLGRNPGHVMELIDVPVPRRRDPSQLLDAEFLATRRRLEELIHPPSAAAAEKPPPVMRMTPVGDDVW